ncbi:MAG: glycosyltransferase [Rhodospirillales bacterium]
MSKPKVLFYVQHLLGIGHVKRAATIARAMTAKGMEVTVVSGGDEIPVLDSSGMDFVQLFSLRANDRSFDGLVDADGNPIDDDLKNERKQKLLEIFKNLQPSVLMIELYPFGRRQLRFELIPLLEAAAKASPRPHIVCSVRDILVEKNKPHRDAEMVETAREYFDDVLIHGDPNLIPFKTTFGRASDISDMLHYTGYVVEKELAEKATGEQGLGEIIVSSGSGAVGENLLRTALEARPLTSVSERTWRILVGYSMADDVFDSLKQEESEGLIIERARSDFVTLLKNSHLSISQGGYNTVMEVLATKANGISVPYAGGHETEQTLRVRLLAERELIRQIPEEELTVGGLITEIDKAVEHPLSGLNEIDMNGADKTAEIISSWT